MFTCPSGSEGFGTCLWEKLDNCEETSSRKPRTNKQQSLTVDVLLVQGTGISTKMKTLKVKVMRFQKGTGNNLDVDKLICVLNCDK